MSAEPSVADRELRAFYAVVAAVCYLTTLAAVLACFGKMTEAVGVGAAVTGLLALGRSPTRAGVNVESAGQVGPNGGPPAQPDPPAATPPTSA